MNLFDLYETYRAKNRKLRAASTDNSYRVALRQFRTVLGREPIAEDLTDDNLQLLERYLTHRSPHTINERTSRLKALWRWLAKQGMVATWPSLTPLPAPEPYRRAWTVDQVRKLIAATDGLQGSYAGVSRRLWWKAMLLVLWDTGERSGATRAMQFDWMTDDGVHFPGTSRKGHKAAYYRLGTATRQVIESIRSPIRLQVFPWDRCESTWYGHYGRLLRLAGLPDDRKSKAQRMRRTHLTYWAIAGQDPSKRAQHTSRAVTETYYLDETMLPTPDPGDFLPPL